MYIYICLLENKINLHNYEKALQNSIKKGIII